MNPEEYTRWLKDQLQELNGIEYIKHFFMPEDLESYIRDRCYRKNDWDDPIDWVNGMTIGLAFHFREYLPDNNTEAQFRIQLAIFISDLVWRIEHNEN